MLKLKNSNMGWYELNELTLPGEFLGKTGYI